MSSVGFNPNKKVEPLDTQANADKETLYFWLDILGFSDKSQNKEYEELLKLLRKFHNTFVESEAWDVRIISDGLLLKIRRSQRTEDLPALITSVGNLQLKYILENKEFIRGGFALGSDLENSKEYGDIITNGLSKSVKIENRSIDWPIIGTSKKEFETIRNYYSLSSNETFGMQPCFNSVGEDIVYIDFLAKANEVQIIEYGRVLSLKINHFADKKKEKNVDERRICHILQKYCWLYKHLLTYRPDSRIPDIWDRVLL
jgi:hypothetical protein